VGIDKCSKWDVCTAGEYQKSPGTRTADRICDVKSPCRVFEYQVKPATATAGPVCAAAGSCTNGALIAPSRRKQANHCGTCNPGYQLAGTKCAPCPAKTFKATLSNTKCRKWNTCTTGEFQKTPGTRTADRVCSSHKAPCNANQYEVKAPTATTDRLCSGAGSCTAGALIAPSLRKQANHCGTCNPGYQLAGTKCAPCPAKTFKATLSNTKCRKWNTCSNGEFQKTPGTRTADRVCSAHKAPCNANEYEVKAPTATTDRLCSGAGSCTAGALIAPSLRKQANHCGSCNAGYTLVSRKCVVNTCTCANGQPKTGAACTQNGALMCQSCRAGYMMSGTTCVARLCMCQYGQPKTGAACTQNGASMCQSCLPGFVMNTAGTLCTNSSSPSGADWRSCKTDQKMKMTCTKYCKVDSDKNGKITVEDLLKVLARFGETCASDTGPCAQVDFDANKQVDVEDLLVLLAAFGETRTINSTLKACCTACASGGLGQGRRRLQPNASLITLGPSVSGTHANVTFTVQRLDAALSTRLAPRHCVGAWSSWGKCSKACDGGTQHRIYIISIAAKHGGHSCPILNGHVESRTCNTDACLTHRAICTCVNGIPLIGSGCTRDGAPMCQSCTGDFVLNANKTACFKLDVQLAHTRRTCVCENGTPATGSACPENGATMCVQCKTGFTLNPSTAACMLSTPTPFRRLQQATTSCRDKSWPSYPYLTAAAAPQWTSNVLFMSFLHASEMTFGFKPNKGAFQAMIDQLDPKNRPNCNGVKQKACSAKCATTTCGPKNIKKGKICNPKNDGKDCKPQFHECATAGKDKGKKGTKKGVWKCSPNKEAKIEKQALGFTASLGIGLCLQVDKGGKDIYQQDCNEDRPTKHVRGRLEATVAVSVDNLGGSVSPNYELQLIGKDFTPIPVGAMVDNVFDTMAEASGLSKGVVTYIAACYSPMVLVLKLLRIEELEFRMKYKAINSPGPKPRDFHFDVAGTIIFRNLKLSSNNPLRYMVSFMHKLTSAARPRMQMITDVHKSLLPKPKKSVTVKFKFGTQPFCFDDLSPRGWVKQGSTYFHPPSGTRQNKRPADFDCDRSDPCVAAKTCDCRCKLRSDDREGGGLSLFMQAKTGKPMSFELGFQTGIKLMVQNREFLHFVGKLAFAKGKTGPYLSSELKMYGLWQHAFGIDKLHMRDAVAAFGVKLPPTIPLIPNNFMLGAQIMMGNSDPAKCKYTLGAYVGYDSGDPTNNFALIYGTTTPTVKELMHTFLSAKAANTMSKILSLSLQGQALLVTKVGPYNMLHKKKCLDADLTKIKAGCPGLSNRACYELFTTCYFVAWAAPLGVTDVKRKLQGFKGPGAIMNALPDGSHFGASGAVSMGGVVYALSFETGLVIPGVGTSRFKFKAGCRLFDFFLGDVYFGYDLGFNKAKQKELANKAPKCRDAEPKCKKVKGKQQYANCDTKTFYPKTKWMCKNTKPAKGSNGDASALARMIPEPEITLGGQLMLDMAELKRQLKAAVTSMLDVTKELKKIGDLLGNIPATCRKLGVPNFLCNAIDKVFSGGLQSMINSAVKPLLAGVETVLKGLGQVVISLIDSLPDTSVKLKLDAKARINRQLEIEVALKFDLKIKNPDLTFALEFGNPYPTPLKFTPAAMIKKAVDGLKNKVKSLVLGKSGGDPVQMLKNAIQGAKKKLVNKGREIVHKAAELVKGALNALGNMARNFGKINFQDSRKRIPCGRNYGYGFASCTACKDRTGGTRHVLPKNVAGSRAPGDTKKCFGACLQISMTVYDAWVEATSYQAVKMYTSPTWWNANRIAQITVDGADECEALCSSDMDCVGFTLKQKACLLAARLPTSGVPWRCKSLRTALQTQYWDCRQAYWSGSSTYKTVDPRKVEGDCGDNGSCFFKRITRADGRKTPENPDGVTINDKIVTHRPCPSCRIETATIRDWTSGSCCERQVVEPYELKAISTECQQSGVEVQRVDSLNKCAQQCATKSIWFIYGSSSAQCSSSDGTCRCWCETNAGANCNYPYKTCVNLLLGTVCTETAVPFRLYKFKDNNKRGGGRCTFMTGTGTKRIAYNTIGSGHVASSTHAWCDATYDPKPTANMGRTYQGYFRSYGKNGFYGQDLKSLKYEPSRCVAGFDPDRREHYIVDLGR
jgi:hypothetical protein